MQSIPLLFLIEIEAMKTHQSLVKHDAKLRYWQEVMRGWKASGQSQSVFCKVNKINLHSFKKWRGIVRSTNKEPSNAKKSAKENTDCLPLEFVPVKVKKKQTTPSQITFPILTKSEIKLLLPSGLMISIPPNYDEETLLRITRLLS